MKSLTVAFSILMGLIAFVLWIQLYVPFANDTLIPYITCSDNAIPNSGVITTIIQLMPLVVIIVIMIIPIMQATEPEARYYQ